MDWDASPQLHTEVIPSLQLRVCNMLIFNVKYLYFFKNYQVALQTRKGCFVPAPPLKLRRHAVAVTLG